MIGIFAETYLTLTGQRPGQRTLSRRETAQRAREAKRKADLDFLRRYGDRHF